MRQRSEVDISEDPISRLNSSRWKEDMLVTNHFGERVWLKRECPASLIDVYPNGYITECCAEESPCKHHKIESEKVVK